MPIFGRRQLQRMLNELGPWLTRDKTKDLLKRLENVAPDQALPAEYELGLTWGVSKIATLQIDRLMGTRTPDIYSPDLLTSGPLVADVAALNDVSLSGAGVMRRARNIINLTCDEICRRSSEHLQYTFREKSGYSRTSGGTSKLYRHRLVTRDFQMDQTLRDALKLWLANGPPSQSLTWNSRQIGVVIEWRGSVHPMTNVFCTMPSLAYDLRDNPLYRVLKMKSRQLRNAPEGIRRAIFLGDAGCSLLRDLRPVGSWYDTFSGQQIIQAFLGEDRSIDLVVVFSVKREWSNSTNSSGDRRVLRPDAFGQHETVPEEDFRRLELLTSILPKPYLGGYQAYSWHEQGMCSPDARGKYLPVHMSIGRERMTFRISARAVQELMAGKLSPETFRDWSFGKDNPVSLQLAAGRTISAVRFEPKGDDEDDDYLVFEFREDPAATELGLPIQLRNEDMNKA